MAYVDGFVLPVPTKNLAAYKKMAKRGAGIWREVGAIEYYECVLDDPKVSFGLPFPKAIKAKPGETVVISWILYKSKADRNRANQKMMQLMGDDPAMASMAMPFDIKRMAYGGFKPLVSFAKK